MGSLPPDRSLTVLLVDDDRDQTTTQSWLLQDQGMTVLTGNSAKDCLDLVTDNRPDLILLDLSMPGTTGFDLCRRLKSHPNCQSSLIVAQSGYGDAARVHRTKEAGFDGFLIKPVRWAVISEVIDIIRSGNTERLEALWHSTE